MRNGLKALGIERSTEELEALLKTSATSGTSWPNMWKGVAKLGEDVKGTRIEESRHVVAELFLYHALRNGRPVVLLVDRGEHWVVAVGLVGHRCLVADSADSELVLSYTQEEVMKRWRLAESGKAYWGVVL